MKRRTILSATDVPLIFSDERVRLMVSAAKLAIPADKLPSFASDTRDAVLFLFREIGKPTSNEVHHQIAELVRAAVGAAKARKRPDAACENVARLVERLSPPAQKIMNRRGTLPDLPAALRDPTTQRDACHTIIGLGRVGVRHEPGRKRAGDKRSMTAASEVYAPTMQERPLRREVEHEWIMLLENAHLRATGELPPATAHRDRPSEFADFLRASLDAIGSDADAIGLLGERQRRRRTKQRQERLRALLRRWDATVDTLIARLSGPKS